MYGDDGYEPSDADRELARRQQAEANGLHICELCGAAVIELTPVTDAGETYRLCDVCR